MSRIREIIAKEEERKRKGDRTATVHYSASSPGYLIGFLQSFWIVAWVFLNFPQTIQNAKEWEVSYLQYVKVVYWCHLQLFIFKPNKIWEHFFFNLKLFISRRFK